MTYTLHIEFLKILHKEPMCFLHEDLNLSCLVMRWSTVMLSLVFHYPELKALREKLHSRDSVGCYIAVGAEGGDEVSPKTIPSFNFFVLKEMFELRVWNCCVVCSDKRRAKTLAASERFDPGHQHVKTNLSHRLQNKEYPTEDLAKTHGKKTRDVLNTQQPPVVSADCVKTL